MWRTNCHRILHMKLLCSHFHFFEIRLCTVPQKFCGKAAATDPLEATGHFVHLRLLTASQTFRDEGNISLLKFLVDQKHHWWLSWLNVYLYLYSLPSLIASQRFSAISDMGLNILAANYCKSSQMAILATIFLNSLIFTAHFLSTG